MSKKIDSTENPGITTVSAPGRHGMSQSFLNIAFVNKAGKQGKSTICRHILQPRLNATVIAAETLNRGSENADEQINGNEWEKLYERLLVRDKNILMDVGGSNFERIFKSLARDIGSLVSDGVDLFVVPFAADPQLQDEATDTAEEILNIGGRVCFVQNFYNPDEPDKNNIDKVREFATDNGISLAYPVPESPAFLQLAKSSLNLFDFGKLNPRELKGNDRVIAGRAPHLIRETEKTFNDIIKAATAAE